MIAVCRCNPPHTGNGTHCDPPDPCDAGVCSENADCESVMQNGTFEVKCTCRPMFIGNGKMCMRKCCLHKRGSWKIVRGGGGLDRPHDGEVTGNMSLMCRLD